MSGKETEQMKVFEQIKMGRLTQIAASRKLGLTDRQVRNKYKRYLKQGTIGLIHRNRGRVSKCQIPEEVKLLLLELLQGDWNGFKPKFAAEQLWDRHAIKISRESVRKLMIAHGLWKRKKRGPLQYRERRERKEYFGEMIQLDGSPHDWFEGRGPKCTLLAFIDDATSAHVWLEFVPSESVESVMKAARNYIEKYGRPRSIYTDHGSVFRMTVNNPDHEKKTQWERAQYELGIHPIHARSPQAKGRVERSHGTNQDRLVWLMRMENISTMEEGNAYLQTIYMDKHNAQFAVSPTKNGDLHRSVEEFDLDNILCIKDVRKVQNDYIISYKTRIFQLHKQQATIIRPKEEVTIHEHFDEVIEIWARSIKLSFREIKSRLEKENHSSPQLKEVKPYKPASNHPWRRS